MSNCGGWAVHHAPHGLRSICLAMINRVKVINMFEYHEALGKQSEGAVIWTVIGWNLFQRRGQPPLTSDVIWRADDLQPHGQREMEMISAALMYLDKYKDLFKANESQVVVYLCEIMNTFILRVGQKSN